MSREIEIRGFFFFVKGVLIAQATPQAKLKTIKEEIRRIEKMKQ